ncbi:ABC transporter permease subunit [Evansella sp. AB-P1]|uniref:ABC transporter permease subunit n=1 Tax=Evansella sp. AB-P1 TaxID=3037653 RepID=UPI00241C1B12|nr:ABC transporter permease subunit [Evansella sp. AB-P1]MDG5789648.1 ABC transporter permease subunit [Evansella sp. AB-P1]
MKNPIYITAISCLFLLFVFCFILPIWFPSDIEGIVFLTNDEGDMIFPPFPPSSEFWLGTDSLGHDMFQQLVLNGQNTLLLVFLIVILRFMIAVPLGYFARKKTGFIFWTIEKSHHYLSALPVLLLVILFMNLAIVEASSMRMGLVIMFIVVIEVGRLSYILSNDIHLFYQKPYYEATKMIGSTFWHRFKKYDLRHIGPTLAVMFMLELAKVMLLIGQLGFLSMFISQQWFTLEGGGIEIQNRFGTWGSLLADTRDHIRHEFWIPLAPVIAITFAMFTFHLCAEALKKYFSKNN